MHLNNEQLLEPGDTDLKHLSQCQQCRSRMENLGLIRTQLQSIPERAVHTDQWQEIKQGYQAGTNLSELASAKRTINFWRVTSGAIAASFALFVIWQSISVTPKQSEQLQNTSFTALIDENSALQRQLNNQLTAKQEINARTAGLLVELDIINIKLQKAYLEKGSKNQKQDLWQQRQVLLKSTLAAIRHPHVIKI